MASFLEICLTAFILVLANSCMAEKAGQCPAPPAGFSSCIAECSTDDNCEGAKKCCHMGCGIKCEDPELPPRPKPGKCPVVNMTQKIFCPRFTDGCATDDKCDFGQKCCEVLCKGLQCVDPEFSPKCPKPVGRIGIVCTKKGDVNCYTNADCRKEKKKCCSSMCGGTECK